MVCLAANVVVCFHEETKENDDNDATRLCGLGGIVVAVVIIGGSYIVFIYCGFKFEVNYMKV